MFDPWPGHTTLQIVVMAAFRGAEGCRVSISNRLADVRINGPVGLVTNPVNTVI